MQLCPVCKETEKDRVEADNRKMEEYRRELFSTQEYYETIMQDEGIEVIK